MARDGTKYLNGALEFLKCHAQPCKERGFEHNGYPGVFDAAKWKLRDMSDTIPQQENGIDCGVFVIYYMDLLSLELPLMFGGNDMPHCRSRLLLSIFDTDLVVVLNCNLKLKKMVYKYLCLFEHLKAL